MDDKKRRSSILKPQKARNPLGDLDMRNDEEIEDTAVIRSRRVSFASSYQVKQFIAVAEKNTIWDSTYEESVQGSDNSPLSLHLQTTESCTINKENVNIATNLDVTTIQDMSLDDLDLTPTVDCIISTKVQENIKHLSEALGTHKDQVRFKEHEVNTVEITKVVNEEKENTRIKTTEHQTIICDKTVEITGINRVNRLEEDMEMSCMSDMTFTAAVPAAIHKDRTTLMSADMDFTLIEPQNVTQSVRVCDSSMDLTRPLQAQIVVHQVQDMSLNDLLDPRVSFTMPVGANIQEKTNDQTMEMDFTKPLQSNILKLNVEKDVETNATNDESVDMEFTIAVNPSVNENNDISLEMDLTNAYSGMEFTRAVGGNKMEKPVADNVDVNYELEFTKPVESEFLKRGTCYDATQTIKKSIVNHCLTPNSNMNLANTNSEMEFTRPVGKIMGKPVEENVDVNYELEFTKPVESEFLKRGHIATQTIKKSIVNDCLTPNSNIDFANTNSEMEFTRPVGKIMGKPVEENVDVNYELEFTKPVESEFLERGTCYEASQTIKKSIVNDCLTPNGNMNLTNKNSEMEFTRPVGKIMGKPVEENVDVNYELEFTKPVESEFLKRATCVDAPQTINESVVVDGVACPSSVNLTSANNEMELTAIVADNVMGKTVEENAWTQAVDSIALQTGCKNIENEKLLKCAPQTETNKSLDKSSQMSANKTDKLIMKNIPSTSKDKAKINGTQILPKSVETHSKKNIDIEKSKDNISSNFTCETVEESFKSLSMIQPTTDKSNCINGTTKPSTIVLDKIPVAPDDLITIEECLTRTSITQSSASISRDKSNTLLETTKPSINNLDITDMRMDIADINTQCDVLTQMQQDNISKIVESHQHQTSLRQINPSENKKKKIDQICSKITPSELSQTSKTIESDNLIVENHSSATNFDPDCSLLGKRSSKPLKHSSETMLTPVVSSKRKRIGKNPKMPIIVNTNEDIAKKSVQSKLFTDAEQSLQTIDEMGNKTVDDQSLHCMTFDLNSANTSTYDDTNHLINYNVSGKSKSDFSKIAMGEHASFPKLDNMPLGEFNSNSFHVSLLAHPPEHKNNDDVIADVSFNIAEEGEHLKEFELSHSGILDSTRPPEFVPDMTNSSCDSVCLEEHNPKPKSLLDEILTRSGLTREDLGPFADIPLPDSLSLIYKEVKIEKIDLAKAKRRCDKMCALYRAEREKMTRELEEYRNAMSNFDTTYSDSNNSEMIGDFDDSLSRNLVVEEVIEKTTLDKINDIIKRNENQRKYWFLLSSAGDTYKFSTFYKTIFFTVHLKEDFVTHIELENRIENRKDEGLPEGHYAHKIFMEKLALQSLQKSLGVKFDIFSLLDYVQMTMLKQLDLISELEDLLKTYGTILHDDFKLKFSVIRINLMFVWEFTIDMLELEPVNDKTVTYFAKLGVPRNEEIDKCRAGCPNGVPFVRTFIQNIIAMVDKKTKK